nr:MAG TPA: hypothetical protein [Caudoviricetes sp.]DAO09271.1 MAG TPA: hypothetical protein [Caudoviricetes sp.]DAS77527.1 MAG TPA: hypothetical protein [Caudoviricetes sp.]
MIIKSFQCIDQRNNSSIYIETTPITEWSRID